MSMDETISQTEGQRSKSPWLWVLSIAGLVVILLVSRAMFGKPKAAKAKAEVAAVRASSIAQKIKELVA